MGVIVSTFAGPVLAATGAVAVAAGAWLIFGLGVAVAIAGAELLAAGLFFDFSRQK